MRSFIFKSLLVLLGLVITLTTVSGAQAACPTTSTTGGSRVTSCGLIQNGSSVYCAITGSSQMSCTCNEDAGDCGCDVKGYDSCSSGATNTYIWTCQCSTGG